MSLSQENVNEIIQEKQKIEVDEQLNVKSKAHIVGEVIVSKLSVEPGAEFSATCVMKNTVKPLPKANEKQQAG